jgi:hypothetical protein
MKLLTSQTNLALGLWLLSTLYICNLWLTVPFIQSSGGIALWHTGFAESLLRSSPFSFPPHLAHPFGAPIVFGASFSYLQYLLMTVLPIDGVNSYSIVGMFLSGAAVAGCFKLARTLGASIMLAMLLAIAYLSQVFFSLHIGGYGATGYGFALLPGFCFGIVATINACSSRMGVALSLAALTAVMIFLAFLDGYTFVMALACAVAVVAARVMNAPSNWRIYLTASAVIAISSGAAFALYEWYVPETAFPGYPPNIFAYLSIHIPSMLWPTQGYSMLFDQLGASVERTTKNFVGVGLGNHETVFLSISAILFSVVGLFARAPRLWKITGVLLILGGLLMAIGPVLPESSGTIDPARMEAGQRLPIFTMPTGAVYQVPGLDQMRATYRWIAVVKLGVWMLLCLACIRLSVYDNRGKVLSMIVPILMILETSSNPVQQWQIGTHHLVMAQGIRNDLSDDLKANVPSGSKVLFLPITNDFVIHSIAGLSNIYTYNVGGDKNLLIATSQRLTSISKVAEAGPCMARNMSVAARQGELDFVALELFDGHRGVRGWVWPLSKAEIDYNTEVAGNLSKFLPPSSIKKGKYFWFVDVKALGIPTTVGCP